MSDYSNEQTAAIKDLVFRIADDHLILGHRNSEWTGLGPILEEDIAFSSMAQDKLGQAQALYQILQKMGEVRCALRGNGNSRFVYHCSQIQGKRFSCIYHQRQPGDA